MIIQKIALLILSCLLFSGCLSGKSPTKTGEFSPDSETTEPLTDQITPYLDSFAAEKIAFTETKNLNQEFKVSYKTFNPDGVGQAEFKAKSFKPIDQAGLNSPDEGKKLYLLELAVKGYNSNRGSPSTFNQIGDTPSPQFVVVDTKNNQTYVEETYFSDSYTTAKKLFELSKLTMDGEQWVTTAIVFQVDSQLEPDLAFRFINKDGKIEFYDIK